MVTPWGQDPNLTQDLYDRHCSTTVVWCGWDGFVSAWQLSLFCDHYYRKEMVKGVSKGELQREHKEASERRAESEGKRRPKQPSMTTFGKDTMLLGNSIDEGGLRDALLTAADGDGQAYKKMFEVLDPDKTGTVGASAFRRALGSITGGHLSKDAMENAVVYAQSSNAERIDYNRLVKRLDLVQIGDRDKDNQKRAEESVERERLVGPAHNGDIVFGRDLEEFEWNDLMMKGPANEIMLSATDSGNFLKQNEETRAHELPWPGGMKGRVVSATEGSVLNYGSEHELCNTVHDNPQAYSVYRSSGDIIAHTDRLMTDGKHGVVEPNPERSMQLKVLTRILSLCCVCVLQANAAEQEEAEQDEPASRSRAAPASQEAGAVEERPCQQADASDARQAAEADRGL